MRTLAVVAGIALSAFGGAPPLDPPPIYRFSLPTADQRQFMKDRYACMQEAREVRSNAVVTFMPQYGAVGTAATQPVFSGSLFMGCMGARGYTVDSRGPLAAPPESVVYMQR